MIGGHDDSFASGLGLALFRTLRREIARRLPYAVLTILGNATVGCGIPIVCMPCALQNDPRDNTLSEVGSWADGMNETDSCRINAMQHCVAAAMLADDCGVSCAVWVGEVLEILQGDGDSMDIHNNEQGSQCNSSMVTDTIACCDALLDVGGLRTDGDCN